MQQVSITPKTMSTINGKNNTKAKQIKAVSDDTAPLFCTKN